MIDIPLLERTVPQMLVRSRALDPARPALATRERTYSHAEAAGRISSAAHALRTLGIGPGEHVAVLMPTSPRCVWILLALAHLGAVPVALNPGATGELLRYYLEDSDPVLVLVDEELAGGLPAAHGRRTLVLPADGHELGPLAGSCAELAPSEATFSDPFVVLYTSGSTGMPKAVAVPHAQAVTCGAIFAEHLALGLEDRLYTCLPLFHINATAYSLCGALVSGACLALGPRFSATTFWQDVDELGATQVNAMGSMLSILRSRTPRPAEREHRVRSMLVAPLPPDAAALADRFGLDFATTYAQTEWLPSAMTRPGEGYDRPGGTGPILDHSEIRIVGEDDRELAPGEIGEITLRAREPYVVFQGYLGKPRETVDALRNLWFHTGDLGEVAPDGWLYFRGRSKDVIRRRGENISATVVENLLAEHPQISEAAAVPVPAEISEEEVFVFVVPGPAAPDLSAATVEEHALTTVPRYMVPSYIVIVPDLPRTATNKIAKVPLTERARAEVVGDTAWRTFVADRVEVRK